MGATFSVIKTLVVPAIIALLVFLLLTYALMPLWQRYRGRYSQYLPLGAISNQTSSLRQRIQGGLARFFVPLAWRQRLRFRPVVGTDGTSDTGYISEDGEELGEVDEDQGQGRPMGGRDSVPDSTRRLSRDLEQGFMDDSDDEASAR